ncbi:MAG: type II toxin-antitoxin system VapC family toxin [Verrucomicrobiales bacterium]
MAWVVDTSVLLDIFSADPAFAQSSAECLSQHLAEGLLVCPVTYVEMAPAFKGDSVKQDQFFAVVGVEWREPWTLRDTQAAHRLWAEHIKRKRAGHTGKRPTADVLIEGFVHRFQGIITRNPGHFTSVPVVIP